ncbi:MAG: hypothetical protein ABIH26_03140 [Candidatus Eisenbacteria bacterium]
MKKPVRLAPLLLAACALALALPDFAGAIPAFARRHKISCNTCHAPFPRLKEYGDEYAGNGFVIPEEERARDYVSEGDALLWLNRDFPVAVRFDAYAVFEEDEEVENDLQTPWGLKLLSGGAVYKNIGYYFYFYMSERGEVAGIEDAYIHFNDIAGSGLDLMVGQFQTSDPLMKRELRLTFEDYEVYRTRVGFSGINLTYDRGLMAAYGIEQTGTDLVAMVVNGNGKPEADESKKFDNDKHKNFGFRALQGIGENLSIGGFVYYGKEEFAGERTEGTAYEANEVTYWGPDIQIAAGPVAFTGQYLVRRDTNPSFASKAPDDVRDLDTDGIVAELVLAPYGDRSRTYYTVLYNRVETDCCRGDYETAAACATFLIARNLRLLAEYTYDFEGERSRAVAGILSAF